MLSIKFPKVASHASTSHSREKKNCLAQFNLVLSVYTDFRVQYKDSGAHISEFVDFWGGQYRKASNASTKLISYYY